MITAHTGGATGCSRSGDEKEVKDPISVKHRMSMLGKKEKR